MRSAATKWLGVLIGTIGAARASDPVLPGDRATFSLAMDGHEPIEVQVPAGDWDIVVESSEFDVVAGLAGGAGLGNHDRGPGLGERIVLACERETRRELRVEAVGGDAGAFTVAVTARDPWGGVTPAREIDALLACTNRVDDASPKVAPRLVSAFRASLEWRDLRSAERAVTRLGKLAATPLERRSVDVLRALLARSADPSGRAQDDALGALEGAESLAWNVDLDARLTLARASLVARDHEAALGFAEEARTLAAERGDESREALAALETAHVLARMSGELAPGADEVADAYDAAVEVVDRGGDLAPWLAGSVRYAAGDHHWVRGDWARARRAVEPSPVAEVPPHLALRIQALLCDLNVREHRFVAAQERIETIEILLERTGFSDVEVGRIEDLAFTFFLLGRYAESGRLVNQVLEITQEGGGLVRAEALITRSALLEVEGLLERAEAVATESLATLAEAERARKEQVDYARAANRINRGRLRRKLGRLVDAEEDFFAALAIGEERRFGNIGLAASHGLAEVYFERTDYDEAIRFIEPVTAAYRALGDRDSLLSALETVGRIELARGKPARVARVLDEADGTLENADALDAWAAAGVRSRYADLARLAQDWVAYRLAAAESSDARAAIVADGFARAGQWKARALLARLQAQEGRPVANAASTRARIAALLGPDRVLLEYVAGRDRLYAYRLSSARLDFFDLGDRAAVERAILDYRTRVLDGAELRDAASVVSRAHALHEALLAPMLGSDLPDELVVVPEGILGTVPFESFVVRPEPEGEELSLENADFVIDHCEVTYAPSAPVLAEQMSRDPRPLSSGRGLLLGDAIFPLEDGDLDGEFGGLMRLDKSRAECVFVADLMLDELPDDDVRRGALGVRMLDRPRSPRPLSDERFDLYLGAESRPSRVLESPISDYTLLHLATHGHVDRTDPTRSGLVLSADDDGARVLDVERIRGLRELDALVVLSACETAGGPVLRGEGVQSIGSAFLEGGARGVVGSLWPVGDSLARELMQPFYRGVLLDGRSASAALDDARRALRRKRGVYRGLRATDPGTPDLLYAHPSVWAPFVYWGRVAPR